MRPKPARTGEQSIGTLCPRRQTSEIICDAVLSECESAHPLNPRTQTSSWGEFALGSVSALSSWTDVCKALCWWAWVRKKELFVWECMHFYWMNTQHKHLNLWTFGAWELSRSCALPPLFRPPGWRLSSRRRARVTSRAPPPAMALPTGTPRFPPDIWLLARSSSSPHRSRCPGVIPSLGRARCQRGSGFCHLLLESTPRHDVTHGFGALLGLREALNNGLHGGSHRSVQQHLTVSILEVSQV